MPRSASAHVLALVALALPACITTRGQIAEVEARVARLEQVHATVLAGAAIETKRLENLRAIVEESSTQLRENAARSGARLQDADRAVARLKGAVEELLHRLEAIEKVAGSTQGQTAELKQRLNQLVADLRDRAGIAILALPAELPPDADGFTKLAEQRLVEGDPRVAAAVARECQKRFAGTEAAGGCGLVLARIAVQEQRYADATRILQEVFDGLGGKPLPVVAQSLIEIANVLEIQGKCTNAVKVLTFLRADMPKTPQAKVAKDLLATAAARCKEGVGLAGKAVPAPVNPDAAPKTAEPAARPAEQTGRPAEQPGRTAEQPGRTAEQPGRTAEPVEKPIAAPARPEPAAARPEAGATKPTPAEPAALPAQVTPTIDLPIGPRRAPVTP